MMHAVVCKRSLHSDVAAQIFGPVAQLVRAPPCHGGGRGFEPHPGRLQLHKRCSNLPAWRNWQTHRT